MIRIDRKTYKDILKVTRRYDVPVFFHPDINGFSIWRSVQPDHTDVISSVPIDEVPDALNRLADLDWIEKEIGVSGNGMIFHITPKLLHHKAFWLDRFSHTYIGGFISGVATSVIAGLILHFLVKLF